MHARAYNKGRMAAAVRSVVSRALLADRRRRGGRRSSGAVAGCFSVYVGAGRERFVVPVERANHPLFRRLLDDAERERGGQAAQGPIALPGCDIGAFLDVLWQMEELDGEDDGGEGAVPTNAAVSSSSSPMCGLIPRSCGANGGRVAARYRTLRPTSKSSLRWWL